MDHPMSFCSWPDTGSRPKFPETNPKRARWEAAGVLNASSSSRVQSPKAALGAYLWAILGPVWGFRGLRGLFCRGPLT